MWNPGRIARKSPVAIAQIAAAVCSVQIAVALTYLLRSEPSSALFLCLVAVVFTVSYAGRQAALLASLLAVLFIAYYLPPGHSMQVAPAYQMHFLLFILGCLFVSLGTTRVKTGFQVFRSSGVHEKQGRGVRVQGSVNTAFSDPRPPAPLPYSEPEHLNDSLITEGTYKVRFTVVINLGVQHPEPVEAALIAEKQLREALTSIVSQAQGVVSLEAHLSPARVAT